MWKTFSFAAKKFSQIDGTQWAGAFAYNAFFSLFPLVVLSVTIASFFIDRNHAAKEIIGYLEVYIPLSGQMKFQIFDTIAGVVDARRQASVIAFLMLVWAALQSFTTLVYVTNRAWDAPVYTWWRVPLKSFTLLVILIVAVLVGMGVPSLVRMAKDWFFPIYHFHPWLYGLWNFFIPCVVDFVSLSLFYKLAPGRVTQFYEVWMGALCATVLLQVGAGLFVLYLKHFATLNVLYGAFGGIMALLLWIYLSGCIVIFGACLCAARKTC